MKQLKVENLTKTYGEKSLFENVTFAITEGERIGVIGVNGTGKSTLLSIIAGMEEGDKGEITKAKDYTIGFLAQDPVLMDEHTVLEEVFQGDTRALQAVRKYEQVLLEMAINPDDTLLHDRFTRAQHEMDATNAWDVNTDAKTILDRLGITDLTAKVGSLSGGQRKRVGLAKVMIETPDLLILDEPTNHLDFTSIRFLEDYLNRFRGAVLLVTHDRYFLDRVTNHMLEIDRGMAYRYVGNYEKFMESKAIRMENEMREGEKNRNLYRKELAWMRRGAKARSTKQKARQDRFADLEGKVKSKTDDTELQLDFATSRLGKQVFTLENVDKRFAQKHVLQDFSLIIQPGERIGITGNNGTGKSTLLNMLAGRLAPDVGEISTGQTVRIGYYTQQNEEMDSDQRMIAYLQEASEVVKTSDGEVISVSNMLERFLFPPVTHGKKIGSLSGGEKRRLFLLKILMERPNVLLLDEPTNDLDTQTLTVLEDYLETFNGTVITVSHDRYFLDKIAKKLLVFTGIGQIETYLGEYSDFLAEYESRKGKTKMFAVEPEKEVIVEKPKEKVKHTFEEKREWAEIEGVIEAQEAKITAISSDLEHVGADFTRANELNSALLEAESELERLMERWEYLSQFAD
ncbi:ABC-F family ATP-binding cassette domain-containing protein [Paenilisteria rocourtiae]|uniref:ATP-binding cassette subfamily F protein uup n=1 Tax=Listeria rocourtiae TaxID=647910 RepID=A0A4R6ZS55_9LIST|nr:ABC-F family ATP-binding cassette domain-containing protein [Listeria rocourtiae]EUJ49385.1 ABC transporter ATP-binding protein [Listeria rocourtiae FSL F6-920]MBC1435844.1 ABC-F family ATP-binding cassette domain-containing protein [Listeria rocourtiae]MBC1603453.1 ABC-F family ATP-binding cassette domain-containing protein [Listeria rocourtiae]TDR55262.1 ATP-binding cassette subfamily F protein uup [Listeria rocourtiae]